MLYPKNKQVQMDPSDFKNPSSEYRGAPFWAWNGDIEESEMLRQFEIFKQMGFGGAHMHVRTGLTKTYLGQEHMALVRAVADKAAKEGMRAYLYDEDRWPSGFAGGYVTAHKEFRARYLCLTQNHDPEIPDESVNDTGVCTGKGRLIACFDVELDSDGFLAGSGIIGPDEPAENNKWYAYLKLNPETPRFNNQTYVNTLDKKAIDSFIETTYTKYDSTVGEMFGTVVPSIFTDEPQFTRKTALPTPFDSRDVSMAWTDDLPETFRAAYGLDLVAGIPELIWDLPEGRASRIRYCYHDHVCQRFTESFADNCGAWCRSHGLRLTGHMMQEPTLESQTGSLGEAMRSYRAFDIPGIDMLCANFEYTTAKQAQSAVHQYGYEGMTSELYGVTNWDFDFRGHKLHGDWQAALGVTLRVPHLSWYSMKGEAKRDYPASISYQSPWWQEYHRIEDHFARVNVAMTRGTPIVKVGVINPIESYWLHWGPISTSQDRRSQLDDSFKRITEYLLFGGIDFDFISESLLPDQCQAPGAPLQVGKMQYDAIIVPCCETLRSTTLDILESFRAAGGNLVFIGGAPTLENALPGDRGKKLYAASRQIQVDRGEILSAVSQQRLITFTWGNGLRPWNVLYQLRQDGDCRWLFVAHGKEPYNKDISSMQKLNLRLKGRWSVTLYDTLTGDISRPAQNLLEDTTELTFDFYDYDSLLLRLEEYDSPGQMSPLPQGAAVLTSSDDRDCFNEKNAILNDEIPPAMEKREQRLIIPSEVAYRLSEDNALLLDQASWRLDEDPWQPSEEILRLDNLCRSQLGWPLRGNAVAQPWTLKPEEITHKIHLRFTINSDITVTGARLALEDGDCAEITLNGSYVPNIITGYYVDKSIGTIALPEIHSGENILEVTLPFGRRTNTEWMYLLGSFGVKVIGKRGLLTSLPEKLAFGDITVQGLPFYGGNIEYLIPVEAQAGRLSIHSGRYKGVCQTVSMDGGEEKSLFLPPYAETFDMQEGQHMLTLKLHGHRRNGFGPVHLCDEKATWIGPDAWRSIGDSWSDQYCICTEGILAEPEVKLRVNGDGSF